MFESKTPPPKKMKRDWALRYQLELEAAAAAAAGQPDDSGVGMEDSIDPEETEPGLNLQGNSSEPPRMPEQHLEIELELENSTDMRTDKYDESSGSSNEQELDKPALLLAIDEESLVERLLANTPSPPAQDQEELMSMPIQQQQLEVEPEQELEHSTDTDTVTGFDHSEDSLNEQESSLNMDMDSAAVSGGEGASTGNTPGNENRPIHFDFVIWNCSRCNRVFVNKSDHPTCAKMISTTDAKASPQPCPNDNDKSAKAKPKRLKRSAGGMDGDIGTPAKRYKKNKPRKKANVNNTENAKNFKPYADPGRPKKKIRIVNEVLGQPQSVPDGNEDGELLQPELQDMQCPLLFPVQGIDVTSKDCYSASAAAHGVSNDHCYSETSMPILSPMVPFAEPQPQVASGSRSIRSELSAQDKNFGVPRTEADTVTRRTCERLKDKFYHYRDSSQLDELDDSFEEDEEEEEEEQSDDDGTYNEEEPEEDTDSDDSYDEKV